jgi:hypothetical protein
METDRGTASRRNTQKITYLEFASGFQIGTTKRKPYRAPQGRPRSLITRAGMSK